MPTRDDTPTRTVSGESHVIAGHQAQRSPSASHAVTSGSSRRARPHAGWTASVGRRRRKGTWAASATAALSAHAAASFGGFGPPTIFQFPDCPSCSPRIVAVDDFDVDGDLDALILFDSFFEPGSQAFVMINDGTGTFTRLPSIASSAIAAIAIGDLDGDGDPDLVTVNITGDAFRVLHNDGTGGATLEQSGALPSDGRATGVVLVDVDDDGDLDAVAAMQAFAAIAIALNDGAGTLGPWGAVGIGRMPESLAAGDLDGDGLRDLVFNDRTSAERGVGAMLAAGDGSFDPPEFVPIVGSPSSPKLARIDADGDVDVAVLNGIQQIVRCLNDGAGGLSAPLAIFGAPGGEFFPSSFAFGDLDGDLDRDLIVTGSWEMFALLPIFPLLNTGDGTFTSLSTFGPQRSGTGVALGDFNGDGSTDLLFASRKASGFGPPDSLPGTLSTYRNLTSVRPPSAFGLIGPPNGLQSVPLPHVQTGPGQIAVNVELAWTVSTGVDVLYRLVIALDPGLESTVLETTLNATQFDLPEGLLEQGTSYWWGVTALAGFGATPSTPPAVSFSTAGASPCPGDLDGDGMVGAADLGLLLSGWGLCDLPAPEGP